MDTIFHKYNVKCICKTQSILWTFLESVAKNGNINSSENMLNSADVCYIFILYVFFTNLVYCCNKYIFGYSFLTVCLFFTKQ